MIKNFCNKFFYINIKPFSYIYCKLLIYYKLVLRLHTTWVSNRSYVRHRGNTGQRFGHFFKQLLSSVQTIAVDCSNNCCRLLPMCIYRQNTTPLWFVFDSIVIATHWYGNTIPIT